MNYEFFIQEARYYVALGLTFTLPPMLLYWLLLHPFIRFWRRLGAVWTYGLVGTLIGAIALVIVGYRRELLAVEYGTHWETVLSGGICLAISVWMAAQVRRRFSLSQLLGLPEVDPQRHSGPMVVEGIYSRIRHPRYVQLWIALLGYALLANYLASYVATALWYPGLWIIVQFEERELRERYGPAYQEYCRRVPRFIPRRRRSA